MMQILHCLHFGRLVKIEPWRMSSCLKLLRPTWCHSTWIWQECRLCPNRLIERILDKDAQDWRTGVLRSAWSLIKCIRFYSDFGLNTRTVFLEASSAWGDFETLYPECFRNFVTFLLIVLLFVDRTVPFRGVITTPESPYDSKLMLRGLYGIGCCSALPWFSSRFCLDNSVHEDTHLSIYYRLWRQEDRFCLSWGSHGLSFAQVSSCAQRLFGIWSFIKRMDECLWLNSAPNHCDQRTANPLSISFQ